MRPHPFENEIRRAPLEKQRTPWRHIVMSTEEAEGHGYTQQKLMSLFSRGYTAVAVPGGGEEPVDYSRDIMNDPVKYSVEVWNINRNPTLTGMGAYVYQLSRWGEASMKKDIPLWPRCHFKEMTLHSSCSDMSGNSDGFECDHCGHTIGLAEWLKKRDELLEEQENNL